MIDFVVAGAGGFVGRHLIAAFRAVGFSAVSDHDFRKTGERARIFINAANDKSSIANSIALLRDKLALAGERVGVFAHLQSFSTLLGGNAADPDRFNAGFEPSLLSPYALGKLLQEKELSTRIGAGPAIWLVYLPVILGEGGSWDAVFATARRHGFVLPRGMQPQARANHVDVCDIAQFFQAGLDIEPRSGQPRRFILNRPEAKNLTWAAFLSREGASQQPAPAPSPAGMAKAVAFCAILVALGGLWRSGLAWPLARLMSPAKPPARAGVKVKKPGNGPAAFQGLTRRIVAHQPYLPAIER